MDVRADVRIAESGSRSPCRRASCFACGSCPVPRWHVANASRARARAGRSAASCCAPCSRRCRRTTLSANASCRRVARSMLLRFVEARAQLDDRGDFLAVARRVDQRFARAGSSAAGAIHGLLDREHVRDRVAASLQQARRPVANDLVGVVQQQVPVAGCVSNIDVLCVCGAPAGNRGHERRELEVRGDPSGDLQQRLQSDSG